MKLKLDGVKELPKVSILEAYREDGIRAQCVEVTVMGAKPGKYTISYDVFMTQHGSILEPGHAIKLENYSRVIGLPVSRGKEQEEKAPADWETAKAPRLPKGPPKEGKAERRPKGGSKRKRCERLRLLLATIRDLAPTKTTQEIAEVVGIHRTVVRYHLRKMGIQSLPAKKGRPQKVA